MPIVAVIATATATLPKTTKLNSSGAYFVR